MWNTKIYYEVQQILNTRKKPGQITQYLIKWKNYPQSQSTWQPITNLENAMEIVLQYQMHHHNDKKLSTKSVDSECTQVQVYQKNTSKNQQKSKTRQIPTKKRKLERQSLQKKKSRQSKQILPSFQNLIQETSKISPIIKSIEKQKNSKEVEKIFYKARSERGDHLYCVIYKNNAKVYLSSQEIRKIHPQEFITFLEQDFLCKITN